jgi:hypothetical protein
MKRINHTPSRLCLIAKVSAAACVCAPKKHQSEPSDQMNEWMSASKSYLLVCLKGHNKTEACMTGIHFIWSSLFWTWNIFPSVGSAWGLQEIYGHTLCFCVVLFSHGVSDSWSNTPHYLTNFVVLPSFSPSVDFILFIYLFIFFFGEFFFMFLTKEIGLKK